MTESNPDSIQVEVVYGLPGRQLILRVEVPAGTTALMAIEASGVRNEFPEIPQQPAVGVFSRKVPLDHVLSSGDRVEIYRPLIADPKEIRRQKAKREKSGTGSSVNVR